MPGVDLHLGYLAYFDSLVDVHGTQVLQCRLLMLYKLKHLVAEGTFASAMGMGYSKKEPGPAFCAL